MAGLTTHTMKEVSRVIPGEDSELTRAEYVMPNDEDEQARLGKSTSLEHGQYLPPNFNYV